MHKLTGRRLTEIRGHLAVLKDRRLPDGDAETLVASMWHLLKPAFDEFDEVARKLQREQQAAAAIEDDEERAATLRDLQRRDNALADHVYEVKVPKSRIQKSHLPKPYKGEAGQMNNAGNAAIMAALAPEFFELTAPEGWDGSVGDGGEDDAEG